ncbi:MAG: hypothetical protein DI598_15000 [Pseudopedobacter saltans]|uniref:DUF6438 domain-containing protein n=1 Tax=Pseudopedobacter saltans TaxID=151895 RepID=A0A2W5EPU8_9SPHI|nr:MAG: hypothetical protein DI598_15000 [Pseudopedobacter saltans]
MIRKLLIVIFSFSSSILLAQKQVEKLHSDEDAVKFVKDYFLKSDNPDYSWKNFQLVDGDEWKGLYNLSQNIIDSISKQPAHKWQTADFNFDKKEDLVVAGKKIIGGNVVYSMSIFLSDSNGGYKWVPVVPEEYQNYPYYFSLLMFPKIAVPGLRLVKWFPDINNQSSNGNPYSIDTIGFAQEYLVNYNSHPDSAIFKDVKFESLNFDGQRTIVELSDLDKGTSSPFRVVVYNKPGDSTVANGKITMDIYAQLLSTINYSGFKNLPDQFQANVNTPQTFILDVNYADGTKKKVTDYSAGGTYTLEAIYQWFGWLLDYTNQSIQQRRLERKRFGDTF